jgi:hypothetical protein
LALICLVCLTPRAAFTYPNANSQQLVKLGSGNGGVTELAAVLKDDNVVYALVRKVRLFVCFCFVCLFVRLFLFLFLFVCLFAVLAHF